MSTRNQVAIFISAVGGVLALFIYNVGTASQLDSLASAVIGIGANVLFVTFSVQWLLDSAMRYRRYRLFFDARAKFEGYWLAAVDSLADRPVEVVTISYNPDSANYSVSGKSLSGSFQVQADWGSTSTEVVPAESQIRFLYEGAIRGGNAVVKGFGYIDFDRAPSGRISSARGLFAELDPLTGSHYHHTSMRRIAEQDMVRALSAAPGRGGKRGSALLLTDVDYGALARAFTDAPSCGRESAAS